MIIFRARTTGPKLIEREKGQQTHELDAPLCFSSQTNIENNTNLSYFSHILRAYLGFRKVKVWVWSFLSYSTWDPCYLQRRVCTVHTSNATIDLHAKLGIHFDNWYSPDEKKTSRLIIQCVSSETDTLIHTRKHAFDLRSTNQFNLLRKIRTA